MADWLTRSSAGKMVLSPAAAYEESHVEVTFSSVAGSTTDGLPVLRPRLPCDCWAGLLADLVWGLDGWVVLHHGGADGVGLVD